MGDVVERDHGAGPQAVSSNAAAWGAQLGAPESRSHARLAVALVVPIFNDFLSFSQLCREIDILSVGWYVTLSIIGVDDGSLPLPEPLQFDPPLAKIERVRIVKLRCNLGHQRA